MERGRDEANTLRAGDPSTTTSTLGALLRAAVLNSSVALIRTSGKSGETDPQPCGDASELGLYRRGDCCCVM